VIVQIYGTKTIEDAKALVELGVDYIGLDVADDPDDRALMKQIVDLVRGRMTTVLLPVFCDLATGLRIVHEIQPDVMHFCATDMLPLSEARAIRKELGDIKMLQAIPVGLSGRSDKTDSLSIAREYQEVADLFILDTYAGDYSEGSTEVPGMIGITGKVHDWTVSRKIVEQSKRPVILAGGLNPDNVAAAIKAVQPWGVDSCTGTDVCRGKKDLAKVGAFIKAAREIQF
jgi:phosphoribosylanthranilate isomerase